MIENSKYDSFTGLVVGEIDHFTMYAVDKEAISAKPEQPDNNGNGEDTETENPETGKGDSQQSTGETIENIGTLPKTGYQIDLNVILALGITSIMLGLAFLLKRSKI